MSTSLDELGQVAAALADPNRRAVLERLAAAGGGTATTLARDLPFSRQAVVKHLTVLARADLVRGERRGKEMRFGVRPEALAAAGDGLARIAAEWDGRLTALKRFAEDTDPGETDE